MKKEKTKELLKEFSGTDMSGILLYVPIFQEFISISFGSGNNLSIEDEEAGCDSYISYMLHRYSDPEFENNVDGGMLPFNSEEKGYGTDITNAVYDTLCFIYIDIPEFIPLKLFN